MDRVRPRVIVGRVNLSRTPEDKRCQRWGGTTEGLDLRLVVDEKYWGGRDDKKNLHFRETVFSL